MNSLVARCWTSASVPFPCHGISASGMAARPTVHAVSFGEPPDPTKIQTYPGVARRASACLVYEIRDAWTAAAAVGCAGYLPHEALVIYRPGLLIRCYVCLFSRFNTAEMDTGRRYIRRGRPAADREQVPPPGLVVTFCGRAGLPNAVWSSLVQGYRFMPDVRCSQAVGRAKLACGLRILLVRSTDASSETWRGSRSRSRISGNLAGHACLADAHACLECTCHRA